MKLKLYWLMLFLGFTTMIFSQESIIKLKEQVTKHQVLFTRYNVTLQESDFMRPEINQKISETLKLSRGRHTVEMVGVGSMFFGIVCVGLAVTHDFTSLGLFQAGVGLFGLSIPILIEAGVKAHKVKREFAKLGTMLIQ